VPGPAQLKAQMPEIRSGPRVPVMIVYLLVVLVLGGALAAHALRPVSSAELDRWMQAHGLDASAEGRSVVARYLRRSRRWRAAGFLPPFLVGMIGSWVWVLFAGREPPQPWSTLASPKVWIAGYLLGAVAAELSWPRPFPTMGVRAAALVPREPRRYLPNWVLPTCWAAAAGTLVAALAPRWLPVQDMAQHTVAQDRSGLAGAGAAVGMAALLQLAARVVLRRRQPYASDEQLAVDDALRSACLHRAAGAGLAFVLLALAGAVWHLAGVTDLRPLRLVLPVISLVCLAAAWNTFLWLRAERWRVPRAPDSMPTTGAGGA
jgi:hypothetical protein